MWAKRCVPLLLVLVLGALSGVEGAGGGGDATADYLASLSTNYACQDVTGFGKCCKEFQHPGTCFKITATDDHPEQTCGSYCLLKGGPYKHDDHRRLGSSECTTVTTTSEDSHHRRLGGASSASNTQCKPSDHDDDHRRLAAASTSSNFCPVDRLYYLHDLNNTNCYNGSLITENHLEESRGDDKTGEYCSVFDYNPGSRVCCIPKYDEPAIPSFNRYTVNRTTAREKLIAHRRRLGGAGDPGLRLNWIEAVSNEAEDVNDNFCAQQPDKHGLFEQGGIWIICLSSP